MGRIVWNWKPPGTSGTACSDLSYRKISPITRRITLRETRLEAIELARVRGNEGGALREWQ